MKIGVNTWVWVSPFRSETFNLLYKIKEMGFDLVEIPVDDPELIDLPKLKQILNDTGLSVTLCGAFGPQRDISDEDENLRKIGKDYIIQCVQMAEYLGSNIFAGPVYSAVGKTRMVSQEQKKREREWCVKNLREISVIAADCGVTIGVEPLNRFETDMINLVDQAVELIKEVGSPVYKIHLDTFHSNIEEKNIPDTIRKLGNGMLCHLHACENDRGTPGTGHIDWSGIRDALKEIDYNGAAVIESFTPAAKEIAKAASIWRPLAESQDILAAEGAVFLKNLFK
ncbi:MAG: sugar phosphate isomerase/epimerase [Paenibacillaceae bacterium]